MLAFVQSGDARILLQVFESILCECWHSLVLMREFEWTKRPLQVGVDHGFSIQRATHFGRLRRILIVIKLFNCSAWWLTFGSLHFGLLGLFHCHDRTIELLLVFESSWRWELTYSARILRAVETCVRIVLDRYTSIEIALAILVICWRLPFGSLFVMEMRFRGHVGTPRIVEVAVGISKVLCALMAVWILTLILIF